MRCLRRVLSHSLLAVVLCPLLPATGHAQLATRFIGQPPAAQTTASRFPLLVELYDTATGARVIASGVSVELRLFRCPGFPAACTPTVVNNSFATGLSSAGLISFPSLSVTDANSDYYFAAVASGYTTGASAVFDVAAARLSFAAAIPGDLSTASRFALSVEVISGASTRDLLADSVPIRLSLLRCPGFPSSCSVVIVNSALADGSANNGLVSFSGLGIDPAADDYYLVAALAPASGVVATAASTNVVDVLQAGLRVSAMPGLVSSASRLPLTVEIVRGSGAGAPVDTRASGLNVRLGLLSCEGFPSSCSVAVINNNFANAISSAGSAQFSSLQISTAGIDRYFSVSLVPSMGVSPITSGVVDVVQAVARIETTLGPVQALVPFSVDMAVLAGTSAMAPIDPLAHAVPLRLRLFACPGFPASCSPIELASNFAETSSVNGVASLSGLVISNPGEDRYFAIGSPTDNGVQLSTSNVFDVQPPPALIFRDGFETL